MNTGSGEARAMAEPIASVAVPGAGCVGHGVARVTAIPLALARRGIDDGQDASLETGLENESEAFRLLASTPEVVEGVRAFREDREPDFTGA